MPDPIDEFFNNLLKITTVLAVATAIAWFVAVSLS